MEIHGADTETTPDGNIACLCTENRTSEPKTFEEAADFLLYGRYTKMYWTFNLQFDSEGLIKLLPPSEWLELYTNNALIYNGYKITFFPKRLFQMAKLDNQGRSTRSAKLYDVAQYYQGMSLNSAGIKYLKKSKMELEDGGSIGARLGQPDGAEFYRDNVEYVQKYCCRDAQLTKELGTFMMDTFDTLGFPTINPISCATISAKYVTKNYKYPQTGNLPQVYPAFAQASYRGGMFQTLQRGLFDQPLYDYDINSAYPAIMVTLPHWANGRFVQVPEPTDAPYGWYMCEFDCPVIPYDSKRNWTFTEKIDDIELEFTAPNTKIYYPVGSRKQIITKAEYEWMCKNKYPVNYLFGIEWYQYKDEYESPFLWMEDFYYERQKRKDAGEFAIQYAMKIILNGLYGKCAQMKPNPGKLTNFFYASYITAETRLQLAIFIHENPEVVVNIATDGIVSRRKLSGLELSKKLGEWEYNEYTKGLFIGSGMYQLWKEDGTFSTKARGITDKRNWNMLEALEKAGDKDYLEFTKSRPLHLGEILHHKLKRKSTDLNRFVDITKKLRVNTDQNHKWPRDYKNFNDLLHNKQIAKPMSVIDIFHL